MTRLAEQLSEDLKAAMRTGNTVQRDEIRGLLAALQSERQTKLTRALDKQGLILRDESATLSPEQAAEAERLRAETDLSEDEAQAVLQTRVKQHRQSIEGFQRGHRQDLVDIELAQLGVLERYLPQQLDQAEIEEAVRGAITASGAQGPRDQGKVMGMLTGQLRGRADMKLVSARVQALLNGNA